jgi:phosphate transport system permease protein
LSVARASGETAPLIFTALGNSWWNFRPNQPTASLTVQIYNDAMLAGDAPHQRAWGAALVLLLLVGALSVAARLFSRKKS